MKLNETIMSAVFAIAAATGADAASICISCPANSTAPAGASSLSACVCDSGYTRNYVAGTTGHYKNVYKPRDNRHENNGFISCEGYPINETWPTTYNGVETKGCSSDGYCVHRYGEAYTKDATTKCVLTQEWVDATPESLTCTKANSLDSVPTCSSGQFLTKTSSGFSCSTPSSSTCTPSKNNAKIEWTYFKPWGQTKNTIGRTYPAGWVPEPDNRTAYPCFCRFNSCGKVTNWEHIGDTGTGSNWERNLEDACKIGCNNRNNDSKLKNTVFGEPFKDY